MKVQNALTIVASATILVFPLLASAATSATWNTVISPSAGGTKTAISFYATGDLLTGWTYAGSGPGHTGQLIGISGAGTSPSNAWTMATTTFEVDPFGDIANLTQGVSRSLTSIGFYNTGGPLYFVLTYSSSLPSETGDTLAWVLDAPPTELVVDLDFSNFTLGTYNTVGTYG